MRCTCRSIREGAGGVSYSLEILGVLCSFCEWQMEEEQRQAWWESLTPAQQINERWQSAVWRVQNLRRPRPRLSDEPPF